MTLRPLRPAALALAAALAAPAAGQDDCSTALPISGTGTWTFDATSGATSGFEGGATVCNEWGTESYAVYGETFFQWTSPAAGSFTFDTYGSGFSTYMAIHDGVGCAARCVHTSRNATSPTGASGSELTLFDVDAGEPFLVQVGSRSAFGGGVGMLNVGPTPHTGCASEDALEDNDTCATALALAPGNYGNLRFRTNDADFWRITVPAGEAARVDFNSVSGAGKHAVHDASCGLLLLPPLDDTVANGFGWSNTTGAPVDLIYEVVDGVWHQQSPCGSYDLAVALAPDPCPALADDQFEDNDTCATAFPLGVGTYTGLTCTDTDPDHYRVTVPAYGTLDVDVTDDLQAGGFGDVRLEVFDAACVPLDPQPSDIYLEEFEWTNLQGVDRDLVLAVTVDPAYGMLCTEYDLSVSHGLNFDCLPDDDAFEPNGSCATAAPIAEGTYPGLEVADGSPDYFSIDVPSGATLELDVDYVWRPHLSDRNLALYLYRAPQCDPSGPSCTGALECDRHNWDDEHAEIDWTNRGANTRTMIFAVATDVHIDGDGPCNAYELGVAITGLGSRYCTPATANSTGAPARMLAVGSDLVADQDFTLAAWPVPSQSIGIFLASRTAGLVANPAGSQGDLCLGNPVARLYGPSGAIQPVAEVLRLDVDLGAIPEPPSFSVAVQPGETWRWQAWFRDANPQVTSNFSDGLEVTFR